VAFMCGSEPSCSDADVPREATHARRGQMCRRCRAAAQEDSRTRSLVHRGGHDRRQKRGVPGSSGAMARRARELRSDGATCRGLRSGGIGQHRALVLAGRVGRRRSPVVPRDAVPTQTTGAMQRGRAARSRRLPTSPDLRATPGGSRRCARSRSRPGPAACGAAAGSRCRPRARRPRGLLRPRPGRAARSARAGGRAP